MGDVLERKDRTIEILVGRDELVLLLFEMDPHTNGADPHFHRLQVDSFFVLEGELQVTVGDETRSFRAGELATALPETVHAFKNASGARVRFLNLHTPGVRFDEYLRRIAAGESPDPAEYDIVDVDVT